jgi:hypothetical protein
MQPVACGHSQQAPQLHPPAWRRRAAPHTFATAMALGVLASRLAGAHQARVSHDVKDLASPSANIIHIRRPKLAAPWRGDTASASWLSAPTGGVQVGLLPQLPALCCKCAHVMAIVCACPRTRTHLAHARTRPGSTHDAPNRRSSMRTSQTQQRRTCCPQCSTRACRVR